MSTVTFVGGRGENVTELTAAIPKERQRPTPVKYPLQYTGHQFAISFKPTSTKTNLSSDAQFLQQTHFLKLCNNTFI